MKTAIFAIFKTGKHISANGVKTTWGESELNQIAENYNKAIFTAPLVLGHPEHNAPAYGEVNKMFVQDGILFAESQVNEQLERHILSGEYNNISASFYLPTSNNSPMPNRYYLRHVGFLGALAPAVKGLPKPIEAIKTATANFGDYVNFNQHEVQFFSESSTAQAIHEKALYMRNITGMSYRKALHHIFNN